MAVFYVFMYVGVFPALVSGDKLTCIFVFLLIDILWRIQKHKHENLSLCVGNIYNLLYWEF